MCAIQAVAMIDIAILCLAEDETRAGRILDALRSRGEAGRYRVRFRSSSPHDREWLACEADVRASACAVMCWSQACNLAENIRYHGLANELVQAGKVIFAELDKESLPQNLAAASSYHLPARTGLGGLLHRALFGNADDNLIVAAATEKAEGRDPPPPRSLTTIRWREFRKRAVLLVPVGLISSWLGIMDTDPVQRLLHPNIAAAFDTASAGKSCEPMREFSTRYPGSHWAQEAIEFMQHCPPVIVTEEKRFEVRAGRIDLYHSSTKAAAEALGERTLGEIATQNCDAFAADTKGTVRYRQLDGVKAECALERDGWICPTEGWAVCNVEQPVSNSEIYK